MRFRLLFLFFTLTTFVYSQKVKDYTIGLKYRGMPLYPLESQRIPLNYQFFDDVHMADGVTRQLESATGIGTERTNFYQMQLMNFSVFYNSKNKSDSAYLLKGNFGLITTESKREIFDRRSFMTPNGPMDKNVFVYDLEIDFPFQLELINKNDSVIYSVYNKNRIKIEFPTYVQEMFQGFNGFSTKVDIEAAWLAKGDEFKRTAKDKLITEQFSLAAKKLDEFHKIKLSLLSLNFYYLKDKKTEFPAFDSALALFRQIEDSVNRNYKLQNNLNWHTKFIYRLASQIEVIMNRQFKIYQSKLEKGEIEKELGEEIVFGIYKNVVAVLFLMDRYDEGLTQLVKLTENGKFHKSFNSIYVNNLIDEFKIQKLRYAANANKFGWDKNKL